MMDKKTPITVAPTRAPLKQYRDGSIFNHGAKALHPVYNASKEKDGAIKGYVSKSVTPPPEVSFFQDTKAARDMLSNALTQQLNQSRSGTPQRGEKISIKNFFENNDTLSQRLYDIVQKLYEDTHNKDSLPPNGANESLYDLLKTKICQPFGSGYSYTNNLSSARNFFKDFNKNLYPRSKIIADFENIEKKVLGISPVASHSRSQTPMTEVSISPMTIQTESEGVSPTEDESAAEEVRKSLSKLINDYIVKTGIELILNNTPINQDQQLTSSEAEDFLALFKDPQFDQVSPSEKLKQLSNNPRFSRYLGMMGSNISLFQGYVESCELAEHEEYLKKIVEPFNFNMPQEQKGLLLKELMKAGSFPMNRTIYLKESADAQKEVCAQEIIRALSPTIVLLSNPYPKYRLSQGASKNERSLSIVPDIPEVRVASEKINFDSSCMKLFQVPSGDRIPCYHDTKKPLYDIKGFGATLQFAKWLGNTDAKEGNIGIYHMQRDDGSLVPIMTHLDSGLCFKVDPKRYKNVWEIANPGWQDNDCNQVCNFLFQKRNWSHEGSLNRFYAIAAEHPQVKRENRITALHIALLPPELYRLFAAQYMTQEENPFLRNNDPEPNFFYNETSYDRVVNEHLVAKGQAVFDSFIKDNTLFGYFFEFGETHQDNIFEVFQNFLLQLEGFHFYQKRDFNTVIQESGGDKSLQQLLEERFTNFIEMKWARSTQEEKIKIRAMLEAWDTNNIIIDRRITSKDSLKKTKVADKLREDSRSRSQILKSALLSKLQDKKTHILLQNPLSAPREHPVLPPLVAAPLLTEISTPPQNPTNRKLHKPPSVQRKKRNNF